MPPLAYFPPCIFVWLYCGCLLYPAFQYNWVFSDLLIYVQYLYIFMG